MNKSESIQALRRANPRAKPGFGESVETASESIRLRIASAPAEPASADEPVHPRRSLMRVSAAGAMLVAAAAVAALFIVGSPGSPGVENAAAAIEKAATVTAASAERSGTAVVYMTHDGRPWAGKTVRWSGDDVAIADSSPSRFGRPGSELRVVDGVVYGLDPEGGWLEQGTPENIDPDSGTTPAEYLAAVREDIGGKSLRRITAGMTGLRTSRAGDGSTVYSGTVAAGLIARESALKGGRPIRVLPFGYAANDEAADPNAPLEAAVTVGADGIVRQIAMSWGRSASPWTYAVTYSGLGATQAPAAPVNARPLKRR